jgi:hypothetical protein
MTPDPYRQAYEKAIEDLTQISHTFEQLNTRRKLVENLLLAFQPILAGVDAGQENSVHPTIDTHPTAQETTTGEAIDAVEPPEGYSFLDVPAPLPSDSDGDPFQRRVKSSFRLKGFAAQRAH